MSYQNLLFDADGTLLDFKRTEDNALMLCFKKYNIELTKEIRKIYDIINHRLWNSFEKGEIDKKTVVYTRFCELFECLSLPYNGKSFEDDYQELLGQGHFLMPGAKELIESLNSHYDLYIVSNGVSSTQFSRMKASGLERYMKKIFVSEDTGYQKPMKEFFDYVFDRIAGFCKEETIIIGDSLTSDIQGGINAGIDTCWFNPNEEINTTNIIPEHEIHTLAKLPSILGF